MHSSGGEPLKQSRARLLLLALVLLLVLTLAVGAAIVETVVFVRMTAGDPEHMLRLLYRHGFFAEIQSLLDQALASAAHLLDPADAAAARTAVFSLMSVERISLLAAPALSGPAPAATGTPREPASPQPPGPQPPGLHLSAIKEAALQQFEAAGASADAVLAVHAWLADAPDYVEIPLPLTAHAGLLASLPYAPVFALGVSALAAALIIAIAGPRPGVQLLGAALALGGIALFLAATWLRNGLETGLIQPFGLHSPPLAIDPRITSNLQGILSAALHELANRLRLTALGTVATGFLFAALALAGRRRLKLKADQGRNSDR